MSLGSKIGLFTDKTFMKFVIVGVINTVVGTVIMFVFYNVFHLSYWVSSASNYIFGSICSYILNKNITFRYHEKGISSLVRFTLNILVCYVLAYGIAKPLMQLILTGCSQSLQENVSMLLRHCPTVYLCLFRKHFYQVREA